MPHGVVGVVDAALYGLVTYVDSILSWFRDGGIPDDGTLQMGIVDGTRLTGRTCLKGILTFLVAPLVEGKARYVGGIPVEDALGLLIA